MIGRTNDLSKVVCDISISMEGNFEFATELESPKLDHLNADQILKLINDYYDGQYSPKELVNKYQINTHYNNLYKLFPPLIDKDDSWKCPYDGNYMVNELNSKGKAEKDGIVTLMEEKCPECGHKSFGKCDCANCQIKDIDNKTRQLTSLVKEGEEIPEVSLDQLDIKDRLYLAALLKGFWSDASQVIYGFNNSYRKQYTLSVSVNRNAQIYKRLLETGAITIASRSPLDAIHLDENSELANYDIDLVNYNLNIEDPFRNKKELFNHLIYPDRKYFLKKKKSCINLWKTLALDECKAYLNDMVETVLFDDFALGLKVNTIIKDLLDNFSQGQIFYFIYHEVIEAGKSHNIYKDNYTQAEVISNIIDNLQSYNKYASDDNGGFPNYEWPIDIGEIYINEIFFNNIVHIPSYGMNTIPHEGIENAKY